jgi:Neocarzinostatin family
VKRFRLIVVSTVGAILTVGLAAAPAGAAPLVSVAPNLALVDAQPVSVSASGFTANAGLAVLECTVGATSQDDCDISTLVFANADGSGNLSTSYGVFRQIFPATSPAGLDCAPSSCLLVVANSGDQTEAASAPLTFDASIPLPPALQITATIDPTGTFDKAGNVTISGTITCNIPADVSLYASATQRAGRALFHADGFGDSFCNGPTRYRLTASPYDGIFRGGNATVTLNFDSFTGRRDVFGTVNATVRLSGSTK